MLTENWTPGVAAVMIFPADKPLEIKPKPVRDMIAATTKMANFVLIFMIFSSVLSFFVSMLTSL
jgi:hypothetical protein